MTDHAATPPTNEIARIEVDRELCIGAATCIAMAPEIFELDNENKAIIKPAHGATDETILRAAKSCPVAAIYLYGKDEQRLYPES